VKLCKSLLLLFAILHLGLSTYAQNIVQADVLILGGGTGGAAAGISAARMGADVFLVEPTPWLGGMLTSAGVSAIDGNHFMPAGIWGEFREHVRNHYGGADYLLTGWVSLTQFEPHVGAEIFAEMAAAESTLEVRLGSTWDLTSLSYADERWTVSISTPEGTRVVIAKILIDGTDLGDVAAAIGCQFSYGMDASTETSETMAPEKANKIIQDFTYAAIVKDYGGPGAHELDEPEDYDPTVFFCACDSLCNDAEANVHPCETMLNYARLPNNKYLINWPLQGNDYYADLVAADEHEREKYYAEAKLKTLQFIYFIQNELGYQNLGLADDEYESDDLLPYMPYHREGRRIKGETFMTVNEILQPYENNLYRTGIAVGDYPIDHHHAENAQAPEIEFPMVPSFSIPLGSIIPADHDALLIADKAMSVSNIANGSTRLQPVVLQIGQVAGIAAAMAAKTGAAPASLPVREIQQHLVEQGGYLIPSYDISTEHPQFAAMQRMGACGIMRGQGEPYKWANRTWFYPDSTMALQHLIDHINDLTKLQIEVAGASEVTGESLIQVIKQWQQAGDDLSARKEVLDLLRSATSLQTALTRSTIALVIDAVMNPFRQLSIDLQGDVLPEKNAQKVNITEEKVAGALEFLETHCGRDGLSQTIILHQGKEIYVGDSVHKKNNNYSCTKSFTSTIFALLQEEGKVHIDDSLHEYLPELEVNYSAVTFRHLLTMTSGYNAKGINRWGEASEDWSTTPFAVDAPLFAPGAEYCYWDEAMMLFGKILTVIAGEPLDDYLDRKVFSKIGFGDFTWWSTDTLSSGMKICNGCTGLTVNAKQMTRYGELFLNDGQHQGESVIPADWVEVATQNHVPETLALADTDRKSLDGRGRYGYNWWIFEKSGTIPVDAYYASGFNHNVLLVIPAWQMVITRMGDDGNPEAGKHEVYGELLRILAQE